MTPVSFLLSSPARALGALALLALVHGPAEFALRSSDHRNLSKAVVEYYEAVQDKKDVQEKLEKVLKQIEAAQKKLRDQNVLAAVEDWEEVFRLVSAERLQGKLRLRKAAVTTARLENQVDVDLAYWVPKAYDPKRGGALPLVIALPAPGQSAAEHLEGFWNDAGLRDSAILVALDMKGDASIWGTFGDPGAPGGIFQVMNALGALQREFHMDWNRIFLAGSGAGFAAAEAAASAFPNCWAGLIAIGDVPAPAAVNLGNFRSLATLVLGASEGGKTLETKIGELGFGNCTAHPEGGVAEATAWMQTTRRASYPMQISFSPVTTYSTRIHWLSLGPIEVAEGPRVEARIDRETNTITIDAQKVPSLVISLNDLLVDLDKPIRFVINGNSLEQTVPRSAIEMIKDQSGAGDWGRIFVGKVSEDIP